MMRRFSYLFTDVDRRVDNPGSQCRGARLFLTFVGGHRLKKKAILLYFGFLREYFLGLSSPLTLTYIRIMRHLCYLIGAATAGATDATVAAYPAGIGSDVCPRVNLSTACTVGSPPSAQPNQPASLATCRCYPGDDCQPSASARLWAADSL